MKKKVTLDAPRSASLWPEPKITKESPAKTIIATIPDCIERAREAFSCVDSRCDSALRKGVTQSQQVEIEGVRGQCKMILEQLTLMRKTLDSIIAGEVKDSGLF